MIKTLIKENIDNKLFKVISECADEIGVDCYVVGGYVRDLLMGLEKSNDIDILIVGDGIEIAKMVSKKLNTHSKVKIYKNFRTAAFKYQNVELEFVGSRKESYKFNSRNPTVEIGTLDDDLNRRDFTINSIGICLNSNKWGELIDKFNGIVHIGKKLIITPLDPVKTFSDDPLRMLRGVRFSCQLNFLIDSECLKIIEQEKIESI